MSQQHRLQAAWQLAKAVQQLHDRHMLNLNITSKTVMFDDFGDVVLLGQNMLCHTTCQLAASRCLHLMAVTISGKECSHTAQVAFGSAVSSA